MVQNAASSATLTGVLVSGGLDSCILAAHLLSTGQSVQPFYVRTGVTWEPGELAATRRFLDAVASPRLAPLVTLDLPLGDVYQQHWSFTGRTVPSADSPDEAVFLPGRNALLLIKAAVWCQLNGVDELAMAPLGTSPFADATTEFITRFQAAINFGADHPVRIVLPFANSNKRDVMHLGRRFPLEHTFSCISPVAGRHCGACNKCAERRQAFVYSEMPDPTSYDQTN